MLVLTGPTNPKLVEFSEITLMIVAITRHEWLLFTKCINDDQRLLHPDNSNNSTDAPGNIKAKAACLVWV